jgi:hypothetical protein
MPTRTRSIRTASRPSRNASGTVNVSRNILTKILVLSTENLANSLDCTADMSDISSIFEEANSLRSFAENHGLDKEYMNGVRRSDAFIFDEVDWNLETYMDSDIL